MNKFPEISTERLTLSRLLDSDWEAVSFLRSDQQVNQYVQRPLADTKELAVEFIEKINNGIDSGEYLFWKISKKPSLRMIGSICLWNFSDDKKVAEIGYDLHPDYQKQGIMNESLGSIIKFGFEELKLVAIEAYTSRRNFNSIKLLKNNSFLLAKSRKDEHNPDNCIYVLNNLK